MMKNILVMAYAISPYKGSEYSVAWNYVVEMSKYNTLTVLLGATNEHLGEINNDIKLPNVSFVPVYPNKLVELLNYPNKKGWFPYCFYLAYKIWHRLAYKKAKELVKAEKFDLLHYLGPIGFREPGYLWKLNIPYMWGPIGGANNVPKQLLKAMPFGTKIKFVFRRMVNYYQLSFNSRLKQALNRTNLLLTATTENQSLFSLLFNKQSYYLPENGITNSISLNKNKFLSPKKYRLIIVGSLIERKAINILLDSLTLVQDKSKLQIDIVGDGPLKSRLMQYANDNGLSEVIVWHGLLPRDEAVSLFNDAHLHVITSLSEGNPTTIWEAMSYGVPTLTLDHCGMHDIVCEECGIKIPVNNYSQIKHDIAQTITDLLENPQRFRELAMGTVNCAAKFLWNNRIELFLQCYDEAIADYKKTLNK